MNIGNYASNTLITGTAGNDSIKNYGSKVTIQALGGNDSIQNYYGSKVIIQALGGNDSIYNNYASNNCTINAGDGSDTINNDGSGVSITGGAGNDYVGNYLGNNVTIQGGAGNDSIHNEGKNVSIDGGEDGDTIYNDSRGSNVLINGGAGDDSIKNSGSNVTINAGAGDDSVWNSRSAVTVDVGAGDDYIQNSYDNVSIDGGSGNDTILFKGGDGTLNGGEGNDSIWNNSDSAIIYGGAGNDSITNSGSNVTINAGAGDDSITNSGSSVTVDVGAGNDYIDNQYASNVTISGGAGNDTILFKGGDGTLNGGEGNDSIWNNSGSATIYGGAGNDTIVADSGRMIVGGTGNDIVSIGNDLLDVLIVYNAGDGNDVVYGFKEDSSISIAGGDYTSQQSGNDIIFTVGEGKLTLAGAATLPDINMVENALNTINNSNDKVIIGTNAPDTILNRGSNVTIQTKSGNDTIQNSGANVYINGGEGYDDINNQGDSVTINAGRYIDEITNTGNNVLFTYSDGDNDDTIKGFKDNSTLSISSEFNVTTIKSDNDIIAKVGERRVRLVNAATLSTVNIVETPLNVNNTVNNTLITGKIVNDTIINSGKNVTILGNEGSDSIKNTGDSVTIDGGEGADFLANDGSNATLLGGTGNDSIQNWGANVTIEGGTGNDSIWNDGNNVFFKYSVGDGNDFIEGFKENSSLSIAGAGYYSVKSGNDIVLTVENEKITLKGAATLSTVNIIETPLYIFSNTNNTLLTGSNLNDTIHNWGENVTVNALGGNDSIRNNNVHVVVNGDGGNDTIENIKANVTIDGGAGNDHIQNGAYWYSWYNGGPYVSISGGAGDDSIQNSGASTTIDGGAGVDFISNSGASVSIAGGDGDDSISNSAENVTIDAGGGADSITNTASNVSINLGGGDDTYANTVSSVTINGGADNDSISNNGASVSISGGDGNDFIQNTGANVTVDGGTGVDTISNNAASVSINGGAGNDSISNNGASVSISGGDGNDFIQNSGSNVTILGSEGNDTISLSSNAANNLIVYHSDDGNDVIQGFNETSTLLIADKPCTSAKSGSDIILTIEDTDEKITIKGAATLSAVNIDALIDMENSVDNTIITGSGANDYIDNRGSNVTINALGGDDTIDNSGANVTIDGGDDNDSINNSWNASGGLITGGAGDDSISNAGASVIMEGGTGNDYLLNDGNNVTFDYTPGDGNDLIIGFNDNSTLIISEKTQFSTTKSGNDLIVSVGDGKITLEGAATLSTVNITLPFIRNHKNNTIINGTRYNDTIENDGACTINAFGGNDSISNLAGYVLINAGEGNDTIKCDSEFGSAEKITINGGTGDDYIDLLYANKNVIRYAQGDGNDFINVGINRDQKVNSTLDIYDGYYNSVRSGENIIVTVGGGQITLSNKQGYSVLKDIYIKGIENVLVNRTNYTNDISITAADYDDRVVNYGSNVTIITSGGKDTIDNRGNSVSVNAGAGSDTISNSGNSVLADGGADNDTISNSGDTVTIYGGADNDSIANSGHNVSVDAGAGNDSIINGYNENEKQDNNTINAGDGDDYIYNYNNGDYTTLLGDKGNDTIHNNGDTVSIDGGEGNDYIYSYSFNGTIAGGTGNDTISLSSSGNNNVIRYREGDGKDVIYGFKENSMLDIDSSNYALIPSGSDIIVRLADDEITVKGAMYLRNLNIAGVLDKPSNIAIKSNNTIVFAGNYDDTISNTGQNVTIFGNGGNDSINSSGSNVIINGGNGNDYIYNNRGDKSLVDGGAGDDTINNKATNPTILGGDGNDSIYNGDYGNKLVIDGGAGNDTIKNTGSNNSISGGAGNDYIDSSDNGDNLNNTINAGTGNDSIYNDSANILFQYKNGDGSDLIEGFNATSTLSINGGARDDTPLSSLGGTQAITTKSGNDIIVTVGDGKVTLKNAANLSTVNIVETPININNNKSNATVYGTNTNDTIINTGDKVAILALKGKDSLENNGTNVSVDAGAGNDFISNNGKNATLSGSAGNDSISNHSTRALLVGGADNDSIFNNGRKNTISGGDGNDSIENYKNSEEVSISGGAGNDSIRNAGNKVTLSGGAGNDTIINDYGVSNLISGEDGSDLISIQGAYRNSIIGGTGNDTINLDWASTRTLIQYNIGDGSDLIEGFNSTSTLQIGNGNETYSKSISGDDVIITVGKEKITLAGAASLSRLNIAGVVKLNVNNTKNEVELTGGRLDDSVVNSGNSVTISAAAGKDTISNSGRYVSISGGADDDSISSNKDGDFVSIDGAEGNDRISVNGGFRSYISGGKGDDSIYVPQTNDALIQYTAGDGNDIIRGFNETSTLQLGDGTDTFSKTVKSGNVIITAGEGQITLAGAASVSPLYINGTEEIAGISTVNNSPNVAINGTEGNDTITNYARNVTISAGNGNDSIVNQSDNVSISGGAGNDSIFNNNINSDNESITLEGDDGNDVIENRTDYVLISGGDGDDSISNFGSNVTISGAAGNDSISNEGSNVVFNYTLGEGSDIIYGFNETSTLNLVGDEFTSAKSGNDIVIAMGGGNVTLKDAAKLATVNVVHAKIENPLDTVNAKDRVSIVGTSLGDTISNKGRYVTIQAADGKDSIYNNSTNNVIDAGAGNDSIVNDYGLFSSISGGAGNDLITVTSSNKVTVNAGTGDDEIYLNRNDALLIEYNAGDGNDFIQGFNEVSTLNIAGKEFTSATSDNDVVITVGTDKITLDGAATLSTLNIINGTYVNFTIENSKVSYDSDIPESVIKAAYQFNKDSSLFTLDNSALKDYVVAVENGEKSAVKVNWDYGKASLSSASTLEYQLDKGKNVLALTSNKYGDKITFSENATFTYGEIEADVLKGSAISTKGDQRISFDNNSFADVTAPEDTQIDIAASRLSVNDLPINSENGAGTITVNDDGLSFEGYGVQFVDLEIAKESYFGKLSPMTATYNSDDESYTIQNTAVVKTLLNDFTKIAFDFSTSGDENYAYYKVNDKEFMVASDDNDINVVEANGTAFKIQDKEIDTENIGRITLDEQITFSGTEIEFDGVKTNYALNKPVSYSLDGEEISISDAATVETGDETKNFKCEAGSYVVNGRSFETSAALTFTADTSEIRIPLSDAKTEIYFDGVQVSGISDGGEIVFDLDNDKVTIPDGANLNITSPEEVNLNLAAGSFTIDDKSISIDSELEITADKDELKVPLSENPVTINGAAITGDGEMTIDNTDALFFSILLPDGAFVENPSRNTFELSGDGSSASFGDAAKKVQLTDDGTAYIEYDRENGIGVGFNTLMFEHVEISGVDAWTVETSGTSGIDKITGITDGATVSASTKDIDAGDLRFEVETSGAGEFTIAGQKFTSTSDDKNTYVVSAIAENEIKVVPLSEEYADDDSEAAGKVYTFDTAGNYTVNGITFHATENSKVQTITRGVELDLSSGTFQYDGLTLSGSGTAQINRYNASLVSFTDGAVVSGDDESKYQNRQFEIEGTVELIGKKFESDAQIRCVLLNIEYSWDLEVNGESISIPVSLSGFVVDDKYVFIQDDCYEGVTIVDKKVASIEGVKAPAEITGTGLSNVSILTSASGEFTIRGRQYNISGDLEGVTFVTDSHGNVSEINGLQGSVEGNFENVVSVNGAAIRLTGASTVKVTSDGESITEISNVAGDLLETDGNTYRKNVRVYELGGAEKLTTSADGTIIFSGNKFETSAGKTFELDDAGNVLGIEKVDNALVSANVAEFETVEENFATINLSTTDGLEEVFGDFSEGLTVNGVPVKVTDSTNFVVKDDENVYIETTAPDTFTINGKTFKTSADKTIFKLDESGDVSEIVTDTFYPDEEAYLIEGDFSDEIIFNGQKFCVKGTNDTNIFLGEESLITINLARNAVEVVENGGVSEIALSGAGEITVGGKTFTTSDDFAGTLQTNSVENFVGTISGELGGLDLLGITVDSEDNFSVSGDGEKITAIDNLQNGSVTGDALDYVTINGEKISVDDAEETTLTIQDGKLKTADEEEHSTEDISDIFTGDAEKITVAGNRATIKNYDAKTGEGFKADYSDAAFRNGKLTLDSGVITFDDGAASKLINFYDADDERQKVGFASDDASLDASKEKESLILYGGSNSTLIGGAGKSDIYLKENGESTVALSGKNTIYNFSANFDYGDRISIGADADFKFDGEDLTIKSDAARGLLESISGNDGAARILTVANGKELKTAVAQKNSVIASGDELADVYIGEKSGVDFTGYSDSLTADLSDAQTFRGINRVTVGGGQNTLISSSHNETLTGSDGTTEYIFKAGNGRDAIQNFNFDEDKINVGNETITAVNVNSAGGVRMEISGDGSLTLDDAQGKNFRINSFVAKVDKNIEYGDAANYFVATASNATLTVTEGAEIWLDGSHGKTFVGDIRTLDASTATGKTELAGNDLDNTILGGSYENSLWGGNGGDDLLQGGAGKNTFFYTTGNGRDTISGANAGDVVYLSQVTLEQIASTNITADSVSINFKDGGTLQINSNANVTYQLADGSKYSANHEKFEWESNGRIVSSINV